MDYEFIIIGAVVFIWLLTAWEAILALSRGRVRRLETDNKELARKLDAWLENQEEFDIIFRFLTFLLICLITAGMFEWLGNHVPDISLQRRISYIMLGILVILFVSGVLARLLLSKLDIVILRLTMPLIIVLRYTVFWPVIFIIKAFEFGVKGISTQEGMEEKTSAEDEIMSLVEHDDEEGGESLEEDEKRMIRGIFDLDDTPVREIMTPRVDMTAIPADSSISKARKTIVESGHSRIPIFYNNIDEIKGIIYAKDFLDDSKIFNTLEGYSHKPLFVPETKNVGDLLEEFQANKIHVAVIIDEYGGTSGIVTLEDILEEIVGEIRDEYDVDEDESEEVVQMPDGSLIVDGRSLIDDLNEEYDLDIPEDEDVDTIGGFVCGEFGKIPEAGEDITVEDVANFKVLKADKRKILSLKITPLKDADE
jgi:CBS domain containing-hemolysin-like protein